MENWHTSSLNAMVKDKPLGVRVLSREVDLYQQAPGILDVADDVVRMAEEFEAQSNSDDISTGFHIAPDLQWFAALGFGSLMYGRWPHLTLRELPEGGPLRAPNEWQLTTPPKKGSYVDPVIRKEVFETVRDEAVVLVTANLTTPSSLGGTQTGALAGIESRCRPEDWELKAWYGVALWTGRDEVNHKTPCDFVTVRSGGQYVDPWIASARCVEAIRQAASEFPGRLILVSMAVPKTVAVAVGWHLVRDELGGPQEMEEFGISPLRDPAGVTRVDGKGSLVYRQAGLNPWANLVPLYYDGVERKYVPTRVNRAQATAEDLTTRLGAARRT